jgi:hypothetical protein
LSVITHHIVAICNKKPVCFRENQHGGGKNHETYTVERNIFLCIASRCCPTCIGHLEKQSPPFFSDTFYQKNSNPDLAARYEQLMREQPQYDTIQTTTPQQPTAEEHQ